MAGRKQSVRCLLSHFSPREHTLSDKSYQLQWGVERGRCYIPYHRNATLVAYARVYIAKVFLFIAGLFAADHFFSHLSTIRERNKIKESCQCKKVVVVSLKNKRLPVMIYKVFC